MSIEPIRDETDASLAARLATEAGICWSEFATS